MNVWEEKWSVECDGIGDTLVFAEDAGVRFSVDNNDINRVKLASAAPDMARVLLAVEWVGTWAGGSPNCCPSCWGPQPGSNEEVTGHTTDCALNAALRKAGVR